MLLQDVLKRLAYGPVGDLAIGGNTTGIIPPASMPKMIAALNAALTSLHTRFCLRKDTLELLSFSGRVTYPLQVAYALTGGGSEPQRFIQDSISKPFIGDLLGVEGVFDRNFCPLGLNVQGDPYAWFTTQFDTLLMGYPTAAETYFVQYRQNHPKIAVDANVETTQVVLPPSLEDALLAKIGHNIFAAMTGESAILKANELLNSYEQLCAANEAVNLVNTSEVDPRITIFERGGWI